MQKPLLLLSSAALLSVAVLRATAGNNSKTYIAAAKPSPKMAHPTATKAKAVPPKIDADSKTISAFIENRCLSCHDTATQKGGLDLEKLPLNLDDARTFETWVNVHDMVRDGEMPPPKKAQPTTPERAAFKNRLAGKLDRKSTRLNSSHLVISYAVFCLKNKKLHTS